MVQVRNEDVLRSRCGSPMTPKCWFLVEQDWRRTGCTALAVRSLIHVKDA